METAIISAAASILSLLIGAYFQARQTRHEAEQKNVGQDKELRVQREEFTWKHMQELINLQVKELERAALQIKALEAEIQEMTRRAHALELELEECRAKAFTNINK